MYINVNKKLLHILMKHAAGDLDVLEKGLTQAQRQKKGKSKLITPREAIDAIKSQRLEKTRSSAA